MYVYMLQRVRVGARDVLDGFWIGWLDSLTPYTFSSGLQAIQHYRWSTHFTVHCCTRTRVHSLHKSYPDNGLITVSLSLQIKHEVFFSPPNSFLAIYSQSSWTAISNIRRNSWQQLIQMKFSSTELSQLLTITNCSLRTCCYIASGRAPRKTPSSIAPYYFRRVYWSVT
jgi:hypothetical protein